MYALTYFGHNSLLRQFNSPADLPNHACDHLIIMDSRAGAAVAFAAGAALGATALYLCTRQQPPDRMSNAAAGSQAPAAAAIAATAAAAEPAGSTGTAGLRNFEQDEILAEQLTRNVQFFGLEAQKTIGGSFVVVVGLGVRAAPAGTT